MVLKLLFLDQLEFLEIKSMKHEEGYKRNHIFNTFWTALYSSDQVKCALKGRVLV